MRKRYQLYVRKMPDFSQTGIPEAFLRLPEAFDREAFVAAAKLDEIDEPVIIGESEIAEELESIQATLTKAKVECLFVDAGSSFKRATEPLRDWFNHRVRGKLENIAAGGGAISSVLALFLLAAVIAAVFGGLTGGRFAAGEAKGCGGAAGDDSDSAPPPWATNEGSGEGSGEEVVDLHLPDDLGADSDGSGEGNQAVADSLNIAVPGTGPFATLVGAIAVAALRHEDEAPVPLSDVLLRLVETPCSANCPPTDPETSDFVVHQSVVERVRACLVEEGRPAQENWDPVLAAMHYPHDDLWPVACQTLEDEAAVGACQAAVGELACDTIASTLALETGRAAPLADALAAQISTCYDAEGMPVADVVDTITQYANALGLAMELQGSFGTSGATWLSAAASVADTPCGVLAARLDPNYTTAISSLISGASEGEVDILRGYARFAAPEYEAAPAAEGSGEAAEQP